MSHAKVSVGGYEVPLIGIPEDATTQECDRCHDRFPLQELRMTSSGGAFYCVGCYLAEERKEVMWK